MKKSITALVLLLLLICTPLIAQEKVDLIVLMDSSTSMFQYYNQVVDYVLTEVVQQYLRGGDTFHLLTFSNSIKDELSTKVITEQDLKSVISQFYLLYPMGNNTDLITSLEETIKYVDKLSTNTKKCIVLLSDGIQSPLPNSKYSSYTDEMITNEIVKHAQTIRNNGWILKIVKVPFTDNNSVASASSAKTSSQIDSNNEQKTDISSSNNSSNAAIAPNPVTNPEIEKLSDEQKNTDYLNDIAKAGGSEIAVFNPSNTEETVSETVRFPKVTFPKEIDTKSQSVTIEMNIENDSSNDYVMKLENLLLMDGQDLLQEATEIKVLSNQIQKTKIRIKIPDSIKNGKTTLSVEPRFANNIRVNPARSDIDLNLELSAFTIFMRGNNKYYFIIAIVLLVIIVLLLILLLNKKRSRKQKNEEYETQGDNIRSSYDKNAYNRNSSLIGKDIKREKHSANLDYDRNVSKGINQSDSKHIANLSYEKESPRTNLTRDSIERHETKLDYDRNDRQSILGTKNSNTSHSILGQNTEKEKHNPRLEYEQNKEASILSKSNFEDGKHGVILEKENKQQSILEKMQAEKKSSILSSSTSKEDNSNSRLLNANQEKSSSILSKNVEKTDNSSSKLLNVNSDKAESILSKNVEKTDSSSSKLLNVNSNKAESILSKDVEKTDSSSSKLLNVNSDKAESILSKNVGKTDSSSSKLLNINSNKAESILSKNVEKTDSSSSKLLNVNSDKAESILSKNVEKTDSSSSKLLNVNSNKAESILSKNVEKTDSNSSKLLNIDSNKAESILSKNVEKTDSSSSKLLNINSNKAESILSKNVEKTDSSSSKLLNIDSNKAESILSKNVEKTDSGSAKLLEVSNEKEPFLLATNIETDSSSIKLLNVKAENNSTVIPNEDTKHIVKLEALEDSRKDILLSVEKEPKTLILQSIEVEKPENKLELIAPEIEEKDDYKVKLEPMSYTGTVKSQGSSRILFTVSGQTQNIGNRNIKVMQAGSTKTIGAGTSDFLIFLYPIPRKIASLYFDGENGTLVPLRPEYFPDYSAPIESCFGQDIRIVTPQGKEMFLNFNHYVSPLETMNTFLGTAEPPKAFDILKKEDESNEEKDNK